MIMMFKVYYSIETLQCVYECFSRLSLGARALA